MLCELPPLLYFYQIKIADDNLHFHCLTDGEVPFSYEQNSLPVPFEILELLIELMDH